ncbi:MAG: MBL fold metallo-hydrolase [Marinilabiliales bacterium]|nr:MBL fold metallo-hydrolase [Marinilabiliales bacterium]
MNQQELEKIVGKCDLLFISHKHEDHAEKAIVSLFLKAGKPVIAPEQLWRGDTVSSFIQHPEREGNKVQSVRLKGGTTLSYKVFPGHQMESIDNNVYLVTTPEGYTIAHTGDEINEGKFMIDFDWIDEVYKSNTVDLLLPNAWTMDIQRIVKGFNPGLVMPGHELELGHTVWDRLPYWGDDAYLQLNYAALKKSSYPVVPLIWGESYRYVPKRFETAPVKSTPRKKRR